ncbi:hypothetical protein LSTR_LSTR011244 [Laodelphax striatellus]|uniref:Aconitase/3-isopropylmalate dehydratase large subunit alpha/beta/alpha domain-containing protein n=1 Tax=Laodelphax striatellus TaxID=195883 RepID=A0A482X3C5_LAOST|nr:hypothetical protein LSTR_LSTR011244 [Laodelphax striatellus]
MDRGGAAATLSSADLPPGASSANGLQLPPFHQQQPPQKTTTLSTIVVNSGSTRVVIALVQVGLLAKRAVALGLSVAPFVKTSLSPGSGVVTYYLRESGVVPPLQQLGFDVIGFGCMTCIGNSFKLSTEPKNNFYLNSSGQVVHEEARKMKYVIMHYIRK